MPPDEALGIAAQLAVAIVGFTGVVTAVGSGTVRQWSKDDRFRLALLLSTSIFALAFALLGLLLLAAPLAPDTGWRLCSALAAAILAVAGVLVSLRFRNLPPEVHRAGATSVVFYAVATVQAGVVVLLVGNAAALARFWPFFLAIVSAILVAILQFVRLLFRWHEPG